MNEHFKWVIFLLLCAINQAQIFVNVVSETSRPNIPSSPCPNIFQYQLWNGEVVGAISLPPPNRYDLSEEIKLVVTMGTKTRIQNYVGKIDLVEPLITVLKRLESRDPSPILYRVYLPSQSPLPIVYELVVNGNLVCQGARYPSSTLHSVVTLNHIIKPNSIGPIRPVPSFTITNPVTNPPVVTQAPPKFTTSQRPVLPESTTAQFSPPTTVKPSVGAFKGCGKSYQQSAIYLVTNGQGTEKGEWPWLTAIFLKTDVGQNFHCGGTLISDSHILTAAHCVQQKNKKPTKPDAFIIYVGKFNLRHVETNSQSRDISRVVVHPSFSLTTDINDDIAIMVLDTPVTFTVSILPACLWSESKISLDTVINKHGTVVGWGRNGNKAVSDEPNKVQLKVVGQEECLRSHSDFYHYTSNTTLCAGNNDGSGPCTGDSGGGLYIPEKTEDGITWSIRGIVSLALKDEANLCDLYRYVVFTDVAKYVPWIKSILGRQ